VLLGALLAFCAEPVVASPFVFFVDPVAGDIVKVNPRTGTEVGRFAPPLRPRPYDTRLGLSMAGQRTLLFELGNGCNDWKDDCWEPLPERRLLYRLDTRTGAVVSTTLGLATFFGPDGLSWQRRGSTTYTYYSHANPIPDIHRFANLGERDEEEIYFFGPPWPDYFPVGGLGGDGNGREFGVFIERDNPDRRLIIEYGPFDDSGPLLPWAAPANDIEGLAFDGRFLYALGATGQLFTLDPDKRVVVNVVSLPSVTFPDGTPARYRFDIAATVPEPLTTVLLAVGALAALSRARASRSRGRAPS